LIISLSLIACAFGFYRYNAQILRENLIENTKNSLNLLDSQMSGIFSNMNESLVTLQLSESFLNIVKPIEESRDNYFSFHPLAASETRALFQHILLSKTYKSSIHFVSVYYDNIGQGSSFPVPYKDKEKVEKNKTVARLLEDGDFITFVPPHDDFWTGKDGKVLSIARAVGNTYDLYGILEYSVDIGAITALLSNYESPDDYNFLLFDTDDSLLFSDADIPMTNKITLEYKKDKNNLIRGCFFPLSGNLTVYKHSGLTDWTMVLNRNISSFTNRLNKLGVVTILAFVIIFATVNLFLYLLTRYLTKPLRSLRDQLLEFSEVVPDIKIDVNTENNEIIVLAESIQDIFNQIYIQNNKLIEARKREMNAHYSAMEAQLNPHFLYNTLSVIGANGLLSNNLIISRMCSELSKLLRYSISYTGKSVTMESEIENIKSYLYIMQTRYEDSLEYIWELDNTLDSVRVPKLILQPLIENCFQHGFHDIPPPWKIAIKSYRKSDYWYISVSNNGHAVLRDSKEQLMRRFNDMSAAFFENSGPVDTVEEHGLGLENTVMRLAIFYDGMEHFDLWSNNSWTTVEIGGVLEYQNQSIDHRR
jgi:sensor histidine kinase YesM